MQSGRALAGAHFSNWPICSAPIRSPSRSCSAFLMSFGPLSIDLFLPSMPEIGRALGAPAAQLQLTISLYLAAFAIGQIIYGPLSDRVGRVPVLLAAFAIYCVASVLCWFAPSIETLVIGRFLQGLGASAAPVVVRAIVRDLHEGVHAGRQLSLMMTFTALHANRWRH